MQLAVRKAIVSGSMNWDIFFSALKAGEEQGGPGSWTEQLSLAEMLSNNFSTMLQKSDITNILSYPEIVSEALGVLVTIADSRDSLAHNIYVGVQETNLFSKHLHHFSYRWPRNEKKKTQMNKQNTP